MGSQEVFGRPGYRIIGRRKLVVLHISQAGAGSDCGAPKAGVGVPLRLRGGNWSCLLHCGAADSFYIVRCARGLEGFAYWPFSQGSKPRAAAKTREGASLRAQAGDADVRASVSHASGNHCTDDRKVGGEQAANVVDVLVAAVELAGDFAKKVPLDELDDR